MSQNRLAPFIQEYIYTQNWTELRQVQVEACRVILFLTPMLICCWRRVQLRVKQKRPFYPFSPSYMNIQHRRLAFSILAPSKPLINDQFERLSDLLKQSDIQVWAWHGDVSQSRKRQLLKQPQGILQITPESLESLFINRYADLPRLFGDLRFVVIDEIHAFMGTQRGDQILCQLSRSPYLQSPRRIGLSATLGDYSLAEAWLRSGTDRPIITPQIPGKDKRVRLALEQFDLADPSSQGEDYYRYLFKTTKSRKCLIFTNNRTDTELIITNLRQMARSQGLPDHYHVHHGSVSAIPCEKTQKRRMRESTPAVDGGYRHHGVRD